MRKDLWNTLDQELDLYRRRLLVSIGVSGVIHLIGHIFMMQMDSFIFGF